MRLSNPTPDVRVGVPRRVVLRAAVFGVALGSAGAGLAGCSFGATEPESPDPLIALAESARSDAALAAAAVAATPDLAARLNPLVTARRAHYAALEQEIRRLDPSRSVTPSAANPPSTPSTAATGTTGRASLAAVLAALGTSTKDAAAVVPGLPSERVGLVASVAACCAGYQVALG